MNQLTNPQFIKDLFRHYNLKPKDYLGQNFLVDEIALDDIVRAADIRKTDLVVEVGPGVGVLTQQLAQVAGQVLAIEKDRTLLEILDANLKDFNNVKVTNQDVLRFNFSQEVTGPYKVVANIPYYLTSHLFRYFLEQANKPESMTFLIQKEVGERVTAQPGDMSVLAVAVQLSSDAEILGQVGRRSFWPAPKVDSVIIKLTPKTKFPQVTDEKAFFRIVKVGFAAKRKQVHNNLVTGLGLTADQVAGWLAENNIDPKARAQDLSVAQWVTLYQSQPQPKSRAKK